MSARTLSISLDDEIVTRAARLAESQGVTLSDLIGRGLRDQLILADGRAAMDEWQAEHGAFTAEELAAAEANVDGLGIPRRPDDAA